MAFAAHLCAAAAAPPSGLAVAEEVAAALREGRPVVALESTIISHGMPYPQNLETALEVLDIPRTLEFLETQGVTVAAYGTDELPAFFTRRSGCRAPARVDTPRDAAAMVKASLDLRLGGGMVLAVPIPAECEAEGELVEGAIAAALAEVEGRGVRGAEVTPFLLERIRTTTGGRSLAANIALVKNNAAVGAAVAAELAVMEGGAPATAAAGASVGSGQR
ncbi:hypothetical protein MNEG_7971 [Monoraphidium neglectum]|uniref:Pseudouridine-5'-phosphate glycosidase n=1 Tax=Monoraphidium neglectum TaxID=145388 RepID=A0A0D2JL70_9CHLO|nr:hypothetical protein MNEG_7971 [Monoraphidium neglectum]KIY99992.1 hypothetical protein MNEG_7971 [Monoraphidium neglectum]|eukprot:XP_013899012.1 hypothetical protein MNEG_7971 [Monoraphidium neglectum]